MRRVLWPWVRGRERFWHSTLSVIGDERFCDQTVKSFSGSGCPKFEKPNVAAVLVIRLVLRGVHRKSFAVTQGGRRRSVEAVDFVGEGTEGPLSCEDPCLWHGSADVFGCHRTEGGEHTVSDTCEQGFEFVRL